MKTILKFYLNSFLRLFDLEINSRDRQKISYSFDFDFVKYFGDHNNITIFDVGANKGQSINRFKSIFKNSIIHSFEPDRNCCEIIKKNYKNDKDIFINQVAASNLNEKKKLNYYYQSTDNSFFKKNNDDIIKSEQVETIKLDDYIKDRNIERVHILKIDTQSFNKEVIEGAKKTLIEKKIDIIEIEMNLGEYYEKKNNFTEIESFLQNYKLAGLNKGGSLINDKNFYLDVYYMKKN
jgi:FkbM family methyltransferase